MPGKVYLVGAGPGAADLVTLRAARLLEQADVVFHDALVNPEILKLAAGAQLFEVGKRCGRFSAHQSEINARLVEAAQRHYLVIRLKGGDPMIFGRAQEEIEALEAAGIEVEVVPGVTAALAASADLRVSLTQRGVSRHVVFVTPRAAPDAPLNDWITPVLRADTAAIYMGASDAPQLAAALIAQGRAPDTPTVLVANASLPEMKARPMFLDALARLPAEALDGPVLILVGEVYRRLAANSSG